MYCHSLTKKLERCQNLCRGKYCYLHSKKAKLRGGCLSPEDEEYIRTLNAENFKYYSLLEDIFRLKATATDKLQNDIYDRRIQEILWKNWEIGTKYNDYYQSLSVAKRADIAKSFCYNSKSIHFPETTAGKPQNCALINDACEADYLRRLTAEARSGRSSPSENIFKPSAGGGKSPIGFLGNGL